MNNLRTNIVGIDKPIQEIQTNLYDSLSEIWGSVTAYGRVYKNVSEDGNLPEWFDSTKQDYIDTFYDDNDVASICFLVSDDSETDDELVFVNNVKCVFALDLSRAYDTTERNDQEAKRDALQALRNADFNMFKITEVQTGVENVFNDYFIDKISYLNMQPYLCFSINFDLNYYINDKC